MGSPAPQSADDALSPEEEALLQEIMAMEQQPQQQPPMQQQPQPSMAVGGVVKAAYGVSVGGGGNLTEDIAIGGNKPKVTTGTDTDTTTTTGKDGMTSVFYIHPDGRRVKVLLLNGKPVGKVPDDFLDFVTDTPENRVKINFQVAEETPVGTGTAVSTGYDRSVDTEGNDKGGGAGTVAFVPTFDNIGIDSSDPVGAATAILGQGQSAVGEAIMEGAKTPLVPSVFGLIGAGITSVNQAEIISIAHANALYADSLTAGEGSVDGDAIRLQIKEYQDKNSFWLADIITSVAGNFVTPGQNRLDDFNELGGKSAFDTQSDDLEGTELSAADIAKKRAADEKKRIAAAEKAAQKVIDDAAEKEQKAAIAAEAKRLADQLAASRSISNPTNIPWYEQETTGQDKMEERKQPGGDLYKAAEAETKVATANIDYAKESGIKDADDYFAANKGGLIARPKKKTKKKKK